MADEEPNISLMLAGDVMLGRGIDQILPHPSRPELYESFVASALDYLALAEARNGPIPRPAPLSYIWGDALEDLEATRPDHRIVNLETAVTRSAMPVPKGINYRMHPDNLACLAAASVDCCVLANNHVLDWGQAGLVETLAVLANAGVKTAGAGHDAGEAGAPAILPMHGSGRLLVYGFACPSSGVPPHWAARADRPGVNFLDERDEAALARVSRSIATAKRSGDIVVVSIHWGPNWGYEIPDHRRALAHRLIDEAGVDVVHGHSSHHPMAVELHRDRLILYGCGDLVNDYEGIGGEEEFRPELALIYLVTLAPDGAFAGLDLLPFRIARFRLSRASRSEADWLRARLGRESRRFGVGLELASRPGEGGSDRLVLRLHRGAGAPARGREAQAHA
jgi:poly-gamma-glutamate synthesis protein (capsule biosynthesis protein)